PDRQVLIAEVLLGEPDLGQNRKAVRELRTWHRFHRPDKRADEQIDGIRRRQTCRDTFTGLTGRPRAVCSRELMVGDEYGVDATGTETEPGRNIEASTGIQNLGLDPGQDRQTLRNRQFANCLQKLRKPGSGLPDVIDEPE